MLRKKAKPEAASDEPEVEASIKSEVPDHIAEAIRAGVSALWQRCNDIADAGFILSIARERAQADRDATALQVIEIVMHQRGYLPTGKE